MFVIQIPTEYVFAMAQAKVIPPFPSPNQIALHSPWNRFQPCLVLFLFQVYSTPSPDPRATTKNELTNASSFWWPSSHNAPWQSSSLKLLQTSRESGPGLWSGWMKSWNVVGVHTTVQVNFLTAIGVLRRRAMKRRTATSWSGLTVPGWRCRRLVNFCLMR